MGQDAARELLTRWSERRDTLYDQALAASGDARTAILGRAEAIERCDMDLRHAIRSAR